jgi:hypothetical protein
VLSKSRLLIEVLSSFAVSLSRLSAGATCPRLGMARHRASDGPKPPPQKRGKKPIYTPAKCEFLRRYSGEFSRLHNDYTVKKAKGSKKQISEFNDRVLSAYLARYGGTLLSEDVEAAHIGAPSVTNIPADLRDKIRRVRRMPHVCCPYLN